MNLLEHQGKALFAQHGIPVPEYEVADNATSLFAWAQKQPEVKEFTLKAQVPSGKRGLQGGVQFASLEEIETTAAALFKKEFGGMTAQQLLIEKKCTIEKEFYLSITLDRAERTMVMVFSSEGGIDIEEVARTTPEKILKIPFSKEIPKEKCRSEFSTFFKDSSQIDHLLTILENLLNLYTTQDALLVEINPLVLTNEGELIALDSKVVLDDNATFRHPEWEHYENLNETSLEASAHQHHLAYVELDGDIAVIGNGAGLVMGTLDEVAASGLKPADFCDVGGGASAEITYAAMEVVLQKPGIKALLINIFGGITRCDEIAEGIIRYKNDHNITFPIVVRMLGTKEEEGNTLLTKAGITPVPNLHQGILTLKNLL